MATGVGPENGTCPVTISYRQQPREYRSLRASASRPWACSGAMYWAVPTTAEVWVIDGTAVARAMPKSITLTLPSVVSITFPPSP